MGKLRKCLWNQAYYILIHGVQFNSKTLFKDGDPVSLQLIFPGAIQNDDLSLVTISANIKR